MRVLFTVSAVVLSLFIAGSVVAGPEPPGQCPPYDDPDMTYDPSPIVNAIDTNMDGIMSREEWTAAEAPEPSWNFFMEKLENKGYISREDFLNEAPPDGVDANCDGFISVWEFLATKEWDMSGAGDGPPPGGDAGGPPGGTPLQK
jgi:hypothetical protein